jgi:hypothetical protein
MNDGLSRWYTQDANIQKAAERQTHRKINENREKLEKNGYQSWAHFPPHLKVWGINLSPWDGC